MKNDGHTRHKKCVNNLISFTEAEFASNKCYFLIQLASTYPLVLFHLFLLFVFCLIRFFQCVIRYLWLYLLYMRGFFILKGTNPIELNILSYLTWSECNFLSLRHLWLWSENILDVFHSNNLLNYNRINQLWPVDMWSFPIFSHIQ